MYLESVNVTKKNYAEFEKRFHGTGLQVDAAFTGEKLTGVRIAFRGREMAFLKVVNWNDLELLMPEIKMVKMWRVRASMLNDSISIAAQWFSTEEEAKKHEAYLQEHGLPDCKVFIDVIEREENSISASEAMSTLGKTLDGMAKVAANG